MFKFDRLFYVVILFMLLLLWSINNDLKELKSEIRWNSATIELLQKDIKK